jgi:hypothetical protein
LLLAHGLGPSRDVGAGVIFPPQAQVSVVGCRDDGRAQLGAVGDAERDVAILERREDFIVEPGVVANSNAARIPLGNSSRNAASTGVSFLNPGGN